MRSEIGAVELLVFEESRKASSKNPAIIKKEIAVRIFSVRLHAETATPVSPELLFWLVIVEITELPKQFRHY